MTLAKREEILNVIDTLSTRYLKGKVRALRLSVIALLTGGHILLEDIPGLGRQRLPWPCRVGSVYRSAGSSAPVTSSHPT